MREGKTAGKSSRFLLFIPERVMVAVVGKSDASKSLSAFIHSPSPSSPPPPSLHLPFIFHFVHYGGAFCARFASPQEFIRHKLEEEQRQLEILQQQLLQEQALLMVNHGSALRLCHIASHNEIKINPIQLILDLQTLNVKVMNVSFLPTSVGALPTTLHVLNKGDTDLVF